jgi:hypothetical protein
MTPVRQVVRYMDSSYWIASTEDSQSVGVVLLETELAEGTRWSMLEATHRIARLQKEKQLPGVVGVEQIDGNGRWFISDEAPLGHACDVSAFNWSLERRLEFFGQVANAVQELHRNGLVHGHLAPRNIWLDGDLKPQIVPIGLAGFKGFDSTDPALGYFNYVAPEVRTDPSAASTRSDVFSLGRLLQALLNDAVPDEEPDPIPGLQGLGSLPEGLVRIIRKCTAKPPSMRYGEVGTLLADIGRYGEAEQVGTGAERVSLVYGEGLSPASTARGHAGPTLVSPQAEASGGRFDHLLGRARVALPLVAVVGGLVAWLDPIAFIGTARAQSNLSAPETQVRSEAVRHLVSVGNRQLDGVDLSGTDLSELDLGDASLRKANFKGCRLTGTMLAGADLTAAQLDGARLERADLGGAVVDAAVGLEAAHCDEATLLPESWTCLNGHPNRQAEDTTPEPNEPH